MHRGTCILLNIGYTTYSIPYLRIISPPTYRAALLGTRFSTVLVDSSSSDPPPPSHHTYKIWKPPARRRAAAVTARDR